MAVVGAGQFGRRHIETVRAEPLCELAAIAEGERGWYAPLGMERIEVKHADPQVRQLQHFCRVVRGEEAPRITGADATRTLAAVPP
jgi:hypothetical protein